MITIEEHRKIDINLLENIDADSLRRRINLDTSRFRPSRVNLIRYEVDATSDDLRVDFWSYFRIGAEWLDPDQTQAIVVVPKMGNIDFIDMFMTCLHDNETSDGFADIYDIDFEARPIRSKALSSILSPLLIVQFLMIVKRIANRGLRKDYIRKTENLSRIKGRINLRATERLAMTGHREKANCTFDEYSVDTPENRFIKRALHISKDIISLMQDHRAYALLSAMSNHCLSAFEKVTDDRYAKPATPKANKLYKEYAVASRLASMIMRRQDVAVNTNRVVDYDIVPVFRIDMALLFEHYTLALLRRTFGHSSILYQAKGYNGRFYPDFIIRSTCLKAIVDAKYIDSETHTIAKSDYIKQLSAYCRDTDIIHQIGIDTSDEDTVPIIPCILAHPTYTPCKIDPRHLLAHPVTHTLKFYTLPVPIPTL